MKQTYFGKRNIYRYVMTSLPLILFNPQLDSYFMFVQNFDLKLNSFMTRDANSPANFIPRGFGESGNGICLSLGIGETKTYSPGLGFRVRGIFGRILFQIWSFFLLKNFFFWILFLNQKNDMFFMIRNDIIVGNWQNQY